MKILSKRKTIARWVSAVLAIGSFFSAVQADVGTPETKGTGIYGEFDLSQAPTDGGSRHAMLKEMFEAGETHTYSDRHPDNKLWVFRPEGLKEGEQRPCVFLIHGGSWSGHPMDYGAYAVHLAGQGYVAVVIEWRRYDVEQGFSPKDCLADCLTAYRWVKQRAKRLNIAPDEMFIGGHSAGGHLALSMLTMKGYSDPQDDQTITIDPKGLILVNPAIDLVDGWHDGQKRCRAFDMNPADFSPAHQVKAGLPPTLVISGGKDGVITPKQIRGFKQRMEATGNQCEFSEYPDAHHGMFHWAHQQAGNKYFAPAMLNVERFLKSVNGDHYASTLQIKNPRCEYRVNPLGIDALKPRLGWEMQSAKRGVMQENYRILVASSRELLKQNEGDVWDSGVVKSDQSIQVEYAGQPLQSKTVYFWKVIISSSDGSTAQSAMASWSMGILKHEEWQAKWIGLDDNPTDDTYEQEVIEGKLVIKKAILKGVKSIDITDILNAKIDKGTLGATIKPKALGVENPGGRMQLTVDYEYNGKSFTKQTPLDGHLGDIYLPEGTLYMDTPEGQGERRRWAVPRQLRKEFASEGTVKRATLYVTALGLYEFRINGEKVGDQILAPEWTDYNKRIQYQTFDVTDMLQPGDNAMGALLGNGWYCGGWMFWGKVLRPIYGTNPSLIAQLELEYTDGSRKTVVTDESWRGTTDGPIRFSGIYEGEIYDARREMPGWDKTAYDDQAWKPVVIRKQKSNPGTHDFKAGKLVWQRSEPIRKTHEMTPVAITEPRPGVYVVDMGQLFSGWTRLQLQAQGGTKITMQHGEILNPDGTVYVDNLRAGHFGKGDRQIDRYFCRGDGVEVFEPHFTYHGYQFVEIHGLSRKPTAEEVTGIVFHTDFAKESTFNCSNPLLTRFIRNTKWSMRANIVGIPTDCNQRDERCGYTGDMNFFMPAALYNFDLAGFFNKWLVDVEDAQMPGGWFPDHAPYYGPGGGPNVGWSDAGVLCVHRMYREYGDTQVIREHYDSMTRSLEHQISTTNPDGTRGGQEKEKGRAWRVGLTDHAKPHGGNIVSRITTGTAYLAHNAQVMAEMAAAIGKREDAEKYRALEESTRKAFADKLIDEDGRIHSDSQTGYALAFFMGLVPENRKAQVAQRFGECVEKVGHITTGFMGCPHVLQGLSLAGRNKDAYKLLLNEDLPSWLYMAKHGNAIWEHFHSRQPDGSPAGPLMNSFTHYAHGAAGAFAFSHIGGIRPETSGYKRITIKPVIEPGLTQAKTRYDSIHGPIETSWKVAGGFVMLDVTIPANTTATVHIAAQSHFNVYEGETRADQSKGVTFLRMEDGHALFEIGSGSYHFKGVDQAFDLSQSPKNWLESQPIINEMLSAGEMHAYSSKHPDNKLWVFRPEGLEKGELRPCVFYIHGGSWSGNAPMFAPQSIYLSRRGVVGVSIEFRRYDKSQNISPKDCLADCLSAYRWVKKNAHALNIDPDRIVISGGSAGAHLGLSMLTLEGYDNPEDDQTIPIDPKGLILINPAIDLVDGWQDGQKRCQAFDMDPKTFSPAHHVGAGLPPTLVISGSNDNVIKPEQIRSFKKRMEEQGNQCEFIEYPNVGHGVFNYGFSGVGSEYFFKAMKNVEAFLTPLAKASEVTFIHEKIPVKMGLSFVKISSDADSGISAQQTYTHAMDFGQGSVATVNGVVFARDLNVLSGERSNSGSRTFGKEKHTGGHPPAVSGQVASLFHDFNFASLQGTIELTGLVSGKKYELRLYDRAWGYAGTPRNFIVSYDVGGDGAVEFTTPLIDQNNIAAVSKELSGDISWATRYVYTADQHGKIRITIDSKGSGSYHLYALTNEEL